MDVASTLLTPGETDALKVEEACCLFPLRNAAERLRYFTGPSSA